MPGDLWGLGGGGGSVSPLNSLVLSFKRGRDVANKNRQTDKERVSEKYREREKDRRENGRKRLKSE